MTLPSDLMQSLEMTAFTNFRASGDYAGTTNFDIGGASLLGWALGLRPSKDNFWTSRPTSQVVTGKPWPVSANPGSDCELNAMIATLSTGPLGIADKAGHTNKTIVLRAVRCDGLIIQPDRPATFIEGMFDSHTGLYPNSHIWASHSTLSGSVHYYVLSIDVLQQPYQMQDADLYPTPMSNGSFVAYRWGTAKCHDGAPAVHSGCVTPAKWMPVLHNDRGIAVANDTHVFDLHQLSPVLSNGWVLLGDLDRYIAASRKRFAAVQVGATSLELSVVGAPGEQIHVTALRPATRWTGGAQTTSEKEWTVVVRLGVFARDCTVQPVHGQPESACVISLVLDETQHEGGGARPHAPPSLHV